MLRPLGERLVPLDRRAELLQRDGLRVRDENHAVRVAHRDARGQELRPADLQHRVHALLVRRAGHRDVLAEQARLAHVHPRAGHAAVLDDARGRS